MVYRRSSAIVVVVVLQQSAQIIHAQPGLLENRRQRFRLENLADVLGHGDQARLGRVRQLGVATTLSIDLLSITT
jgi:hypothetical protein